MRLASDHADFDTAMLGLNIPDTVLSEEIKGSRRLQADLDGFFKGGAVDALGRRHFQFRNRF